MQEVLWEAVSALGDDKLYVALTVLIYLVCSRRIGYRFSLLLLTSMWVNLTLKYYFNVPRPQPAILEGVVTPSFPSGHAQITSTFWFFAFFYTRKFRLQLLASATVLTLLVSYSRIALGHHRLEDVVVGSFLGVILAFLFRTFFNILEGRGGSELLASLTGIILGLTMTVSTITFNLGVEGGAVLVSGLTLGASTGYYLYSKSPSRMEASLKYRILGGLIGLVLALLLYLWIFQLEPQEIIVTYVASFTSGILMFYLIPKIAELSASNSRKYTKPLQII